MTAVDQFLWVVGAAAVFMGALWLFVIVILWLGGLS